MVKQMSTENVSIARKHAWEVPFRITLYEIEGGGRFVLLQGGKRKAAAVTPGSQTEVNMEPSGVTANHANNPWTIRNC